ncbi:MAG: cation acetate symporter, partial [Planctomycetota bacterium]
VGVTLGLSILLGRSAKSADGYVAAHGQIPWFVNGVAFAGDYLSAASFLGICGMIAFYGYDGFLYSIGFLAGWIVALFVVAEPMKRLGKFTFADALDARFDSPAIKLSAGVATLAVSMFYLIPQMVGAGVLVQPLLGLDHAVGVILVGGTVIAIVVTAGMVSTTWVQFLKGSLLVVFSGVLVAMLWAKGFEVGVPAGESLGPFDAAELAAMRPERDADADGPVGPIDASWQNRLIEVTDPETGRPARYVAEVVEADRVLLHETVEVVRPDDGPITVNGREVAAGDVLGQLRPAGHLTKLPDGETKSGPLGPVDFLATLGKSEVALPATAREFSDGSQTTIYYAKRVPGARVLRPGEHPRFRGIRGGNTSDKLNFLSLMLALFCGTASLPHILIRYYTVKDEAAARKSTVVGIATIGAFYILTLYIGIGAMTSGALDPSNSNMAAPLLARSLADWLFAVISAIAFTTVLGTVSGLILASAGAVTHDLIGTLMPGRLDEAAQVRVAKVASVVIG